LAVTCAGPLMLNASSAVVTWEGLTGLSQATKITAAAARAVRPAAAVLDRSACYQSSVHGNSFNCSASDEADG
jgi:hypothetical protein